MTEPQRDAGTSVRTDAWTNRRLLSWMTGRFETKQVDAARVVAEMLLAHVLGCDRMRLYMEADRPATPEELSSLRGLVQRAAAHEPVQYLVGRASFLGREFLVDASTMIPQPCTEDLVTTVLACCGADEHEEVEPDTAEPDAAGPDAAEDAAADPAPTGRTRKRTVEATIADLGTGSGCVAISLALQMPRARVVATDVVPAALDLARRNAERLGAVDRIDFRAGSLLAPLHAERFDVLCGNLPYIPDTEWDAGQVQQSVRDHVPATALRGGADGLDFIRPVIAAAGAHLAPGGHLVLEIAHCQREAVLGLVQEAPDLTGGRVAKDHEGMWRVLVGRRT